MSSTQSPRFNIYAFLHVVTLPMSRHAPLYESYQISRNCTSTILRGSLHLRLYYASPGCLNSKFWKLTSKLWWQTYMDLFTSAHEFSMLKKLKLSGYSDEARGFVAGFKLANSRLKLDIEMEDIESQSWMILPSKNKSYFFTTNNAEILCFRLLFLFGELNFFSGYLWQLKFEGLDCLCLSTERKLALLTQ